MKNNKEILNEFGEILITNVFDPSYEIINNPIATFQNTDGYKNLFNNLSKDGKKEFDNIIFERMHGALFNFLKIFEENDQFKLVYEENGEQINLVEISEMLKSEIYHENGWIARFSKELNK
ncbi:hypothetical protein Celal_1205 [Cellulophaga algicola DSM 14237]|uniref:Uncharacterized protein n=1 Tax=Cellulophaga algicola (strain DSM 14237 / IC166 / ACAM 630) TaxID=688270 RepID=E6X767_CELAD|nr:hypothetical protein [Cellulophaga algicola]ADV48520.1 hypothetical protein Celal_1205 [Cellulophaga algicola DSM 14237]